MVLIFSRMHQKNVTPGFEKCIIKCGGFDRGHFLRLIQARLSRYKDYSGDDMLPLIKLIRGHVVLYLILLVSIYSFANYFIIKLIVSPRHLQVERKLAQQEMERYTKALIREREAKKRPYAFHETRENLSGYSLLPDYAGQPQWLLEIHTDRLISRQSRKILQYVLLSNIAVGFVTLLIFLIIYRNKIKTATSIFRGLIDQSLPPDTRERRKNPLLRSFNTDEFSRLSHDLRSMIAGFEQTKEHQQNIITQYTTSLRQLNTMLVEEIKERLRIEENLQQIQEDLEEQVKKRTWELQQANHALQDEIEVRKKNEKELKKHRQRLRALSSELMEMEDKERRQIANDLHDQIGQSLSAVKMYVDALIPSTSDKTTQEKLQQIADIVDQTVQDARTLTFELSPPILYELGLDAALEWLAEEFQQKYSIEITTECDVVPKCTTSAFLALIFRTIRELLINVVRHADADAAEVTVHCTGKSVCLTVTDNGRGMENGEQKIGENTTGGFGLFSIRERVINIGGTVVIDSQKDKGTTITLIIPIRENCSEHGR